jgi:segregation and condensation protein A
MTDRLPILVSLDTFEGPLDLLLYLIQTQELDISKVSITKITDQYLKTIQLMQELDFDVASEFLLIAATLLFWKSRALLPENQKAEDTDAIEGILSQEDLLRQLLEHKRFQEAGDRLGQNLLLGEDTFKRQSLKLPIEKIWREMNITALMTTYQDMLVRERKRVKVLKKETVSVGEKVRDMAKKLIVGKLMAMNDIMSIERSRPEVVATFLASLELGKLRKLRLHQANVFDTIFLELIEAILSTDLDLVTTEFDTPVVNNETIAPEPLSTDLFSADSVISETVSSAAITEAPLL